MLDDFLNEALKYWTDRAILMILAVVFLLFFILLLDCYLTSRRSDFST